MQNDKKYTWHKVADNLAELSFSENGMAEITIGNKAICVALVNNSLSACVQKCPHAGGKLSAGFIDAAGNIVCPLHRYKFRLQNGRNTSGEGYYLKIFPVEMRTEGIFIGLKENNLWNWLK
jgi:nitrite reductase/ring-hydroxylating ferredoxin subunit